MLLSLKLTWYQSQIDISTLCFPYPKSLIISRSSLSHVSLPLLSLLEASVHCVPTIVPIVETRSPITGSIEVRKLCTHYHTLVFASTFLQVMTHTAASWLFRSSHHHHGSLRRRRCSFLQKFCGQLIKHASSHTSTYSGEILLSDPCASYSA